MASIVDSDSVPEGHKVFSQVLQESSIQVVTLRLLHPTDDKNLTAKSSLPFPSQSGVGPQTWLGR